MLKLASFLWTNLILPDHDLNGTNWSNGSCRQVTKRISNENKFWLSHGHLTVQFGHSSCVLKLATWKLHTSSGVEFTKELVGFAPKVTIENLRVAAAMMLLAHVGPINSSAVTAVVPDRRRRTPWTRPASAVGSWDYLSDGPWFAVAGAMVCCVPHPLDITPSIVCNICLLHFNYSTLRTFFLQPLYLQYPYCR